MKARSVVDGDLGFTVRKTATGCAIDLTMVAGVIVTEPATVYASSSARDTLAVFRALRAGIVSAIETAGMVAALRMADEAEPADDYGVIVKDDGSMVNADGVPVDSFGRTWADINNPPYDETTYGAAYLTSVGYRDSLGPVNDNRYETTSDYLARIARGDLQPFHAVAPAGTHARDSRAWVRASRPVYHRGLRQCRSQKTDRKVRANGYGRQSVPRHRRSA